MLAVQVVGFNIESTRKYVFSEAFSEAALEKFGAGMADGTLPPHFVSEDIPAEPTEDGVTVVVGKTFEKVSWLRVPLGICNAWDIPMCL